MNNIYLIEDHDEALKVWGQKNLKAVDLVHLDAHIDFGYYQAKPIEKTLNEARNLKELKKGLTHSFAYMKYGNDFDKQTNIGNYIYPAMKEGIVKNFYWVIPGGQKEFKESRKAIRNILKNVAKNITVCTLENLPVLKQATLIDIDTDFLVIDTLQNADNTKNIGKRKPWILPEELVDILKKKINNPALITIAYSVNGGWTPIKYKHLGDELAYHFAPRKFSRRFKRNSQSAKYFNLFISTGKKKYYEIAVNLNPTYRVQDNNYGPLYLSLRKFSRAENEFLKILKVDSKNPACLLGLGNIALKRKKFEKAKKLFTSSFNSKDNRLFKKVKRQSLLGLAKAEFNLGDFDKSKKLLYRYQRLEPFHPQSYYFLARISEKEKEFELSATLYKDAYRLGFDNIEVIWRLLHVSGYLRDKKAIIKYITTKYKNLKKQKTLKASKKMAIEKILREKYAKNSI